MKQKLELQEAAMSPVVGITGPGGRGLEDVAASVSRLVYND